MSERFHGWEERARADVRKSFQRVCPIGTCSAVLRATPVLALAVGFLMTIIDFVSACRPELTAKTEERCAAREEETRALLRLLLDRADGIEEKLDQDRV